MTYTCSPVLLNKYDRFGHVNGTMTEAELIAIINRDFNLKGTVTKVRFIHRDK